MLIPFFLHLKSHALPVSTRELLVLLEALQKRVVSFDLDDFYVLARLTLIKDEKYYDRFDRAFTSYFETVEHGINLAAQVPEDWLRPSVRKSLSEEEKAALPQYSSEELQRELEATLREQDARHEQGETWVGPGGSSPFGHDGETPEGIRFGGKSQNRGARKIWAKREFRNLDDNAELGTRNIQVALRRLRKFARQGAANELDLDGTIAGTARNAGMLDLKLRPERHNTVKILLLLDIGGSMDEHIQACEELFTACRSEFKHLEHFYFHNCVYDYLWKDAELTDQSRVYTRDLLRLYGSDYKLILVGDGAMGVYELMNSGGAIDYDNEESGATWLQHLRQTWPQSIWLNPMTESQWGYKKTVTLIQELMQGRMFPLTLEGIERGIRLLSKAR